jgi:hypothetical protein
MTMRLCWQALALAVILLATPSHAAPRKEPDIDMFALMTGKCSTLKIAGRDFPCKSVAYFHSLQGRANFSIALDDPLDGSHVISFSGANASREQDDLYELQIDSVLLNSKDRPRVDGLPVPSSEQSTGYCRQLGSFATGRLSTISCNATDNSGKLYQLQFESDGSPMTIRKIRAAPLETESRRNRQAEQRECRHKAASAMVLPRDWTDYVLRCLDEVSQKPPE